MLKTNNIRNILRLGIAVLALCACSGPDKREPKDTNPKTQKIAVPEGFAIEHIYSPSDNEKGSWVAMTFDDKGRMITSDQFGGLFRIELPPIGSDSTVKPKIEALDIPVENKNPSDTTEKVGIGYAQGLLWANNSLYVMINNFPNEDFEKGSGLYRLEDTDNDDKLDKITLIRALKGEGEHGPHSIILGPDSASLYIVAGNHTDLPKMDSYRLPATWKRDNLLPHILDPQGHATDRKEPGGWIAKTDFEGKNWELISAGFRNSFDIAFNDQGELFAYDSDMEWDFGMPWYRPTRLLHVTSGSEFGWRTGNAKWDEDYLDSEPALLNIGQGSPTNIIYGDRARFPDKYRNSLLAFDWSFGIIYSVQLTPEGASYKAKAEEFVAGSPLPLTDGEIGPDGALYFVTGGRKLESDIYRVYYKNQDEIDVNKKPKSTKVTPEFALREEIEQFHKPSPAGTAAKMWEYLGNSDRHIRYAARIAIEHQPLQEWQQLVLAERNITKFVEGVLALARTAAPNPELRDQMLARMALIPLDRITQDKLLDVLRVYEVIIYRMGKPEGQTRDALVSRLTARYPSKVNKVNRSLGKILVAIDDETVVAKTVPLLYSAKDDSTSSSNFMSSSNLILRNPEYGLTIADMLANMPPAQQIYLATMLSAAEKGWTENLQTEYFKWYYKAFGYKGGNSYIGFIDKARKIALANLPKDQEAHFSELSGDSLVNQAGNRLALSVPPPEGPGRRWEIDTAMKYLDSADIKPNFKRGEELFLAINCGSCHTMKGTGGSVGPDLTQLGTRFSKKDILESIIEPSKVISDQYESKLFHMKDGTKQLGRLMGENEKAYIVSQNPYAPQVTEEILKKDVSEIKISEVSIMPPGTLNTLNAQELNDIIAYIMSGGNDKAEVYTKNKTKRE